MCLGRFIASAGRSGYRQYPGRLACCIHFANQLADHIGQGWLGDGFDDWESRYTAIVAGRMMGPDAGLALGPTAHHSERFVMQPSVIPLTG
jgi:hypothetical protein